METEIGFEALEEIVFLEVGVTCIGLLVESVGSGVAVSLVEFVVVTVDKPDV